MFRWLALLAFGSSLCSQPEPPSVRVHGEATVSAQPDRLQMDVGVISQGATSQMASDSNARQSNVVIEALRKIVPPANIKTINFSINPNYQYPKDGGAPAIIGYTANNTVRLEIDDLKLAPRVIEAATRSGASNVNRVTFALRDESKARAEALGKAADQARSGARALAERLEVKLGRLLRIEEEQPVVVSPGRQVEFSATAKGGAESSPVEPGTIEIHASVTLTFEILQ
jgi:hypothetical protein